MGLFTEHVWRVEDKYGKGPYFRYSAGEIAELHDPVYESQRLKWQWSHQEDMRNDHQDAGHPGPCGEGVPAKEFTRDHICGFDTEAAALEWFGPWMEKLRACGFSLVRLKARDVFRGKLQLVFLRVPALPMPEWRLVADYYYRKGPTDLDVRGPMS